MRRLTKRKARAYIARQLAGAAHVTRGERKRHSGRPASPRAIPPRLQKAGWLVISRGGSTVIVD